MKNKVAIVSCGIIKYEGQNELGMWNDEATFKVSKMALDNVGAEKDDLDFVVISTMDGLDGITISNGLLAPAAGAYNKSSVRIETTGVHCIFSAVADILSGNSNLVMVASSDTLEMDFGYVTNFNQDVYFRGPVGFNASQSYGMLAMDYLKKHNIDEKDYARIANKNYLAGAVNPYAHINKKYSTEEIMASPYVNWPLRSLEIGKISNGAVACLIASEEKAKELTDNPVWISGIGLTSSQYLGSWKELSDMKAIKKACKKASDMAGIKDLKKEIDLMEITAPFAPFELIAMESLGFCEEGKAVDMLNNGDTSIGGTLPVNLSGGGLCTNAPNSGGLFRVVQAVKQLNNELDGVNTENMEKALVHDSDMFIGAVGGVSHGVLMLEKGE